MRIDEDEELEDSFTLSSLLKVAKKLNLEFDRTKTSIKIYEKQIKKNRVNVFEKNNRTGYKLSDEGKKCCEEIMLTLPELEDNFNNKIGSLKVDLSYVYKCTKEILAYTKNKKIIVTKSTSSIHTE